MTGDIRDYATDPNLPLAIKASTFAVAEDGFDVVLTITLRLGTNEALDACLRMINPVARVKAMPGVGGDR